MSSTTSTIVQQQQHNHPRVNLINEPGNKEKHCLSRSYFKSVSRELESAARVGLLGVEQTIKRGQDERTHSHNQLFRPESLNALRKPNHHEGDILRIMKLCIFLGQSKFEQFWAVFYRKSISFSLHSLPSSLVKKKRQISV